MSSFFVWINRCYNLSVYLISCSPFTAVNLEYIVGMQGNSQWKPKQEMKLKRRKEIYVKYLPIFSSFAIIQLFGKML